MNRPDSLSVKLTLLLIHQEGKDGRFLRETLLADGYEVIGPVNSVTEAYMAILNEDPDLAILDQNVCEDQSEVMSDTLIQIGIEHLILCHQPPHILKRELGHGAIRGVVMTPHKNTAEGISHELCYMRAGNVRRETKPSGLKQVSRNTPL